MNKVSVEKFTHPHWGECIKVSNGSIEFVMTVEVGPRIIRLARVGKENELYEDIKGESCTKHQDYTKFWGGKGWLNLGGHRFQHSPEAMPRTYIPHDLPICYECLKDGVTVSTDIERIGIQNRITATMNVNGEITIKHTAKNISQWPMEFAPWCITVFEQGGLAVIPVSQKSTGFLPNRTLMLWPYSNAGDSRFEMDSRYIYMTTSSEGDAENVNSFKLGTNCDEGFAMYFNHNNLFVKKFDYVNGENYPDNGCNFECYTNFRIMELESLGSLKKLDPGEEAEHTEIWNLFCDVEKPDSTEKIDELVKKFIN